MPLIRPHHAQQQVKRHEKMFIRPFRIQSIGKRGGHIGGAWQPQGKIRLDFQQQHIDVAALLRLAQTVAVKPLARVVGKGVLWCSRTA